MAENKNSIKVLDDLMSKLSVSKEQTDINAATHNLAIFINGNIEENDAPTKYVFPTSISKFSSKKRKGIDKVEYLSKTYTWDALSSTFSYRQPILRSHLKSSNFFHFQLY